MKLICKKQYSQRIVFYQKFLFVDVPKWQSYSDVSIFFIRPLFSEKASYPTKLARSLACGLSVVVNAGVGDYDEIVEKEKVGVIVRKFSLDSYDHALDVLQKLSESRDLRNRCRSIAKKYFSLNMGI